MEPIWDLAIVGAGPAGASAALSALHVRPAARVLLLDRSDFPRDKACGDGIAPHALDVLASIGVTGIERGYAGVDRLQIGFASGPVVNGVMARPAFVIPREVFDARLVEAAVARGAEFRQQRVRTVSVPADTQGLVRNGDDPIVLDGAIRARLVIAADGASSVIRRQIAPPRARATTWPADLLPWRFLQKPPGDVALARLRRSGGDRFPWRFLQKPPGVGAVGTHTAVAIRGYAPVRARGAGQQEIVFASPNGRGPANWPAYAWSFPIGDGRANVGYGELLGPGESLTRQHLLDRLEELLPGAATDARAWRAHLLPLSTGRPRQPDGRILFVGDAMNLINPVTGEGIFYAVASGVLAGRAGLESGDPGRAYRTAIRRVLGKHFRHTDAAALLARSPAIVSAAVRAAGRNPATFDDLVELGLGAGKLTPSALRGIATALLR